MDPEEEIFEQAQALTSQEARQRYLLGACGGDGQLRRRVDELLAAHREAGALAFLKDATRVEGLNAEMGAGELTEKAGDRVGRYKLLERIGEGGCGIVYVAEQETPVRRRVALKLIKLGMDTRSVVARFEAERQALAMMDHPNIAKVLDAGATETGRPYFVMELVRGVKITEYCDGNRLSTQQRLELFVQVCRAVQHAHQKGIIHRDLKPSNILVTLHDGVPVPKVIDFGIAKATEGRLTDRTLYTELHQFIGTPAYMSPEQAEMSGLDIDTRSDIYSLGVLLYELLTGQTPFDPHELWSAGFDQMRRTIREKEPLRPSTRLMTMLAGELTTTAQRRRSEAPKLIHLVRGDLDWVVMKALEKDRTRRYETANGFAADIERHLNQEPVMARPPSNVYRFQKLVRRNKLAVASAAAVVLSLVLGVVVASWQAVRATHLRKQATAGEHAARQARLAADQERAAAQANELAARQSLYVANMNLAARAWQEHNRSVVLELLNALRPKTGPPDLRGWEWRFLWGASRSDELYTFTTLTGAVNTLAVSPDGKLLAAAGSYLGGGAGVCLWDIDSRKQLATLEGEDATGSLAFSPDGAQIAYATRHNGVRLWDVSRKSCLAEFATDPATSGAAKIWGTGLAFSPDGRRLAFPTSEGRVGVVELNDKLPLATVRTEESFGANALLFLHDNKTLVSAGLESSVRFWSLPSGNAIGSGALGQRSRRAQCLALSPDGSALASGGWDPSWIEITDLRSNRPIALLTNHAYFVSSLAFSPDGKTLASGSGDSTIKLWDTATWKEIRTLQGSLEEIWALAFSRDGKLLFSGAKDGTIKVWDGKTRNDQAPPIKLPDDATSFEVLPGCQTPLCWHTNGTVSVWDPYSLRPVGRFRNPLPEIQDRAAVLLTGSGDRLLIATKQSGVIVWDLRNERPLTKLPWGPSKGVAGAISPDGERFAFATTNRLSVWDLNSWRELATLPRPSANPVRLCISPGGNYVAIANDERTVEVWDLEQRSLVGSWKAHRQGIRDMAFVGRTVQLITASDDSRIALWDPATQQELPQRFHRSEHGFRRVAVSPDGLRVAAAAASADAQLWSLAAGQQLMTIGFGQDGAQYLGFSANGNTLLSVTGTELKLWQAPSFAEIAAAEGNGNAHARQLER